MADVQMDVVAANRFISSLSKSLQALCHGCMDFDAGIEIVGYINVNIDSANKVDYVLNEKVLKSTTNSMTFVSNSFLARKDHPKQCRDGSCSPISELNQPPPSLHSRHHGGHSYPASQHYRSSGIYSPHSQVLRGSKRAWNGPERDWRQPPRKHGRDIRYNPNQQPLHEQFVPSSSNSAPAVSNLPSSSQPLHSEQNKHKLPTEVNIKKELVEGEDQISSNENLSRQTTLDQEHAIDPLSENLSDKINVKEDPDALPAQGDVSNYENSTEALSEADLSSSFLQQPETEGGGQPDTNIRDENKAETNEEDDFGLSNNGSTEDPDGENDNADQNAANSAASDKVAEPSGAEADYEGEDVYSQPSYSGEGSGGGQFEVIEIDDEDEDVQAMFDDTHQECNSRGASMGRKHRSFRSQPSAREPYNLSSGQYGINRIYRNISNESLPNMRNFSCDICSQKFMSRKDHQKHMNLQHREARALPYICSECLMGFYTKSGLKEHELKHQGVTFPCLFCPAKFTIKKVLKAHMERKHEMKQCQHCGATYSTHAYMNHVCGRDPN